MSYYSRRHPVLSQYHVYRESRPDSPGAIPAKDPKRPGGSDAGTPGRLGRRPYGKSPNR